MALEVVFEEDKYKGKSSYVGPKLGLNTEGGTFNKFLRRPQIDMRRIIIEPDMDSLVIDFQADSTDDWMNLNHGSMIIAIDGKTIELEAVENWHDCSTKSNDFGTNTTYTESVYYRINPKILQEIADAQNIGIKVYGENGSSEIKNPEKFQGYAQAFYNRVYDNNAYQDVAKSFKVTNNYTFKKQLLLGLGIGLAIFLFFGLIAVILIFALDV